MNCQLPESVAPCCEPPEVPPPPHAESAIIIITITVVANSKTHGPFGYRPQDGDSSRFAPHGIGYLVNLCMMLHVMEGAIACAGQRLNRSIVIEFTSRGCGRVDPIARDRYRKNRLDGRARND